MHHPLFVPATLFIDVLHPTSLLRQNHGAYRPLIAAALFAPHTSIATLACMLHTQQHTGMQHNVAKLVVGGWCCRPQGPSLDLFRQALPCPDPVVTRFVSEPTCARNTVSVARRQQLPTANRTRHTAPLDNNLFVTDDF